MMKKSVAIATYNGEKYIIEQLESILHQTSSVQEVCICDDCSTDHTVSKIQSFIQEHNLEESWKISINDQNLGYASNFIQALKQTTGDLVFFCDQDDIWKEERVQEMEAIMEQHPHITLLGSEFEPFSVSKQALQVPKWELKQMKHDGSLEKMEWNPQNIFIGAQGCTMCVRQSFVQDILPYWYKGWAYDEFVWKLSLSSQSLYMFHQDTLKRRLHENNTSLNKMHTMSVRVKFLEDLLKSHQATYQFAQDHGFVNQYKLLEKNIRATQDRIDLLKHKKLYKTIPLTLFYRECYHKKRAILVEMWMAMKG